jgi:hypothetical protein
MDLLLLCSSVTTQPRGNAPRSTNDLFAETTTDGKDVQLNAPVSIPANSDSASKEIDESDFHSEKHDEQRI